MKLIERAFLVSEKSLQEFTASRLVDPEDYFAPKEVLSKSARAGCSPFELDEAVKGGRKQVEGNTRRKPQNGGMQNGALDNNHANQTLEGK